MDGWWAGCTREFDSDRSKAREDCMEYVKNFNEELIEKSNISGTRDIFFESYMVNGLLGKRKGETIFY